MSSSQRNWRCSNTDKAANYLGLMRKAGRIALGEYDAGAAARAGQACLVLLAQDNLWLLALGLAVIVGATGAVRRLKDGTMVSVDCEHGTVQALPG